MNQGRIRRNEGLSDETLKERIRNRRNAGLPVSELRQALVNNRRRRQAANRRKSTSELLATTQVRLAKGEPVAELLRALGARKG